jgi:alpha-L-fucosidase
MPNGLINKVDEGEVQKFAAAIKEEFAVNLAKKMKIEASNVRGKVKEFGPENVIDDNKDSYWATDDGVKQATLTINFSKPTTFNRFLVQEYIRLGQRVKSFTLEALVDGNWKELAKQTTIGYKRILRLPTVTATKVRFTVTDSKSGPVISNLGIYYGPQILTAPTVIRNQAGDITITPVDKESVIYFTSDGSMPTQKSKKYTGSFQIIGKAEVRAIACDPATGKISPETDEKFDISRKSWKVIGIENETVYRVLDGNPSTSWSQSRDLKMPIDLIIDLGNEQNLTGFRYLPDQTRGVGIITNYQFYVSQDNNEWKLVDEGEFGNIKNNPLWQTKKFAAVKARYIQLRALRNTQDNNAVGYAEVDVITN